MNASCRGFVQPAYVKSFTLEAKKSLLAKIKGKKSSVSDFARAVKEICVADEGLTSFTSDDSPKETGEETNTDFEITDRNKCEADSAPAKVECKRGGTLNVSPRKLQNHQIDNLENSSIARTEKSVGVRSNTAHEIQKKRRKIIVSDEDSDLNDGNILSPRRESNYNHEVSKPDDQDQADCMSKSCIRDGMAFPVSNKSSHLAECTDNVGGDKDNTSLDDDKRAAFQRKHIENSVDMAHVDCSRGALGDVVNRHTTQTVEILLHHSMHEEIGLDTDNVKAAEELQQTLLPKKKRRASRKIERGVTSAESDKQLNSTYSPPLEHIEQVTEYKCRKRASDLIKAESEFQVWLPVYAVLFINLMFGYYTMV